MPFKYTTTHCDHSASISGVGQFKFHNVAYPVYHNCRHSEQQWIQLYNSYAHQFSLAHSESTNQQSTCLLHYCTPASLYIRLTNQFFLGLSCLRRPHTILKRENAVTRRLKIQPDLLRAGFKCVEALGRIITRGHYPPSNAVIYMHLQL